MNSSRRSVNLLLILFRILDFDSLKSNNLNETPSNFYFCINY